MAIQAGGKRPFPALVIVFLLLLVCLYPGQETVARLLPHFSGLATLRPGLVVLDAPIRSTYTIDLVLVPSLFILSYIVVILLLCAVRRRQVGQELAHRLGAVFSGSFLLLLCLTAGGLLSWAAQTYFPLRIQKGMASLGISADLDTGFTPVHLRGNIIMVVALAIGITLFIARIKRGPKTRQTPNLTREQRMTPYQRMLAEKQTPKPARAGKTCSNQPLLSLRPEAVNYRPM